MAHRARTSKEHNARAGSVLKSAGYAAEHDVHKHEKHMHKGEPLTKLAKGGSVKAPKNITININTGGDKGDKAQALQAGMALGSKMGGPTSGAGAPPPPPPHPPMAPPGGPPMMGPPPGAGGPPPPMMPHKDGGMVAVKAHYRRRGGRV